MQKKKILSGFQILLTVVCFGCGSFLYLPRVEAASLRKMTKACENSILSQGVLLYMSLGTLADMLRAKRVQRKKTAAVLKALSAQVSAQNRALKIMKVRGSRRAKKFFYSFGTVFLLMKRVAVALEEWTEKNKASDLKDYFTYRNAVVRDVSLLVKSRSRRYKRSYRGGKKTMVRCLISQFSREMKISYITLGILSDAYFTRLLNPAGTLQFLRTLQGMMSANKTTTAKYVSAAFRSKMGVLQKTRSLLFLQAAALVKFIQSRNRLYLQPYKVNRQRVWNLLHTLSTKP